MSNIYFRQSVHLATLTLLANERAVRPGFIAWIDGYGRYSAGPAGVFGIADGYHIVDGQDNVQWADDSIFQHAELQAEIDRAIAAENEIKLAIDGYATTLELQGETERAVAVEQEIKVALDGYLVSADLGGYATLIDLDGYASELALQAVEQEIKAALDGYATLVFLDGYASELALQGEVNRATAAENEIKNVLDGYSPSGLSGEATLLDGYVLVSLPGAIPANAIILFSRKTSLDFIGDVSILYQNTNEFVLVSSSNYDQSVISWSINGTVAGTLVVSNVVGEATLTAGTVDVPVAAVAPTQRVVVNLKTSGGTPGFLSGAYFDATTIRITSTSVTDTSDVIWQILPL